MASKAFRGSFARYMSGHPANRGILRTLIDNSILLIAGTVVALVWANIAHQRGSSSYQDFIHFDVRTLWGGNPSEGPHDTGHQPSDHEDPSSAAEKGQALSGRTADTESDGRPQRLRIPAPLLPSWIHHQ